MIQWYVSCRCAKPPGGHFPIPLLRLFSRPQDPKFNVIRLNPHILEICSGHNTLYTNERSCIPRCANKPNFLPSAHELHEARPMPYKQPRMTVRHSQVAPDVHWSLGSGIDTEYDEGCVMELDPNTLKRVVCAHILIDATLRTGRDDGRYRWSWRESRRWIDRCRHRRSEALGASR